MEKYFPLLLFLDLYLNESEIKNAVPWLPDHIPSAQQAHAANNYCMGKPDQEVSIMVDALELHA